MKGYEKVEKVVESVRQTTIYKKSQEMKAKISEKREDFDEYVETTQNPMVLAAREAVDTITAPTDTSLALEEIHYMDPEFNLTEFLEEMEFEMIPKVVTAYLKADNAYMESLCEGHAVRAIMGEFIQRQTLGHVYDERILDISQVTVSLFIDKVILKFSSSMMLVLLLKKIFQCFRLLLWLNMFIVQEIWLEILSMDQNRKFERHILL